MEEYSSEETGSTVQSLREHSPEYSSEGNREHRSEVGGIREHLRAKSGLGSTAQRQEGNEEHLRVRSRVGSTAQRQEGYEEHRRAGRASTCPGHTDVLHGLSLEAEAGCHYLVVVEPPRGAPVLLGDGSSHGACLLSGIASLTAVSCWGSAASAPRTGLPLQGGLGGPRVGRVGLWASG